MPEDLDDELGQGGLPSWVVKLDQIAERLFEFDETDWSPGGDDGTKIIHDAVLGSRPFSGWERAIIDTPALQRLRSVRQLSMAYLVYPTAIHTRFEHSLGVASVAKDMLRQTELLEVGREAENTIAAALLHDIGHGPFSHLSEEMYSSQQGWFDDVIGDDQAQYPGAQPHEAIGALLLKTDPARRFLSRVNDFYGVSLDAGVIGHFITGKPLKGLGAYSAVVNGATDADKVDYLVRDSFFSGIPLSLDVNRLLLALEALDGDALVVGPKGVVPAEQITFAKATLTSALYHHHKVRASDCAFKGFAGRWIEQRSDLGGLSFEDPSDMLSVTDHEILSAQMRVADAKAQTLLDQLRQRILPVAVIPLKFADVDRTSSTEERFDSYDALKLRPGTNAERYESYRTLRSLAEKIHEGIGDDSVLPEEVWVDLPPKPKIGGVEVQFDGSEEAANTFPTAEWTRLYGQYKYRGHVFAPRRVKDRAADVAREVVKEFGARAGIEMP